jgi:hypothetical protein
MGKQNYTTWMMRLSRRLQGVNIFDFKTQAELKALYQSGCKLQDAETLIRKAMEKDAGI